MSKGKILAGYLAPHPPHLVYGENPPQNEARSQGGWEPLRWAYDEVRKEIEEMKPDVLVVHSAHWDTLVGHHVNVVPHMQGFSVDPIFPNLFRYQYDFNIDVELANAIYEEGKKDGLTMKKMENPNFLVDYSSIVSLHMVRPQWDIPVVTISANNSPYFSGIMNGIDQMDKLGQATLKAIEKTGKKAVVLASNTLSHLHYHEEPELPEDMHHERIFNHDCYQLDMQLLELIRQGKTAEMREFLPDYCERAFSEIKSGGLFWMMSTLGWPEIKGDVKGYWTVIGTGNAVVKWDMQEKGVEAGV